MGIQGRKHLGMEGQCPKEPEGLKVNRQLQGGEEMLQGGGFSG